jgi:hypothetical protein
VHWLRNRRRVLDIHVYSPVNFVTLRVPFKKPADQRSPPGNGVGGIDHEMTLAAEGGQQVIFGVATAARISVVHAGGQSGYEERIVLRIDPQHRRSRGSPEICSRLDELVGRAIVVGLAADTCAAPGGKNDNRPADWPTTTTLSGVISFRSVAYSIIHLSTRAIARPASWKLGLSQLPILE